MRSRYKEVKGNNKLCRAGLFNDVCSNCACYHIMKFVTVGIIGHLRSVMFPAQTDYSDCYVLHTALDSGWLAIIHGRVYEVKQDE